MKRLMILAAFLAIAGCQKQEAESERVGEFKVDTLFVKDGCTVYRFYDAANPRYFTNCSGSTEYQSGGKHKHGDGVYGGGQ